MLEDLITPTKDLMNSEPELCQNIIKEVEAGNRLVMEGKYTEAINLYMNAWEQLPEPKTSWELFSDWISGSIADAFFKNAEYAKVKEWAKISVQTRPNELSTSPVVILGMICFELQQYEEAFYWFDKAYKVGQRRAFRNILKNI